MNQLVKGRAYGNPTLYNNTTRPYDFFDIIDTTFSNTAATRKRMSHGARINITSHSGIKRWGNKDEEIPEHVSELIMDNTTIKKGGYGKVKKKMPLKRQHQILTYILNKSLEL